MSSLENLKILLVEDAGVMRKMEVKTLNSLNIVDIIEAEHGEDAIDKLHSEGKPDLIISDWNMPVKDGFELLKWVRSSEEFSDVPFMMATGRGEKKEATMAAEAGVSSFISKPFNAAELKNSILEAIGEKSKDDNKDKPRRKAEITDSGKVKLRLAHIQITDHLVLGVLKELIKTGHLRPKYFELETVSMSSWNPVASALESGEVDGACVLAPIAMDLYSAGAPLKLILFAHRNGSIFVRNKKGGSYQSEKATFFREKSFYIPHTLSIHNMLAHMFFTKIGLQPGVMGQDGVDVSFEVVPPVQMPEFLSSTEDAAGYLVAEPLGTKAIAAGNAELQFLSSELWENHPCCVVTMQEELLSEQDKAMQELTEMLVYAGKFIEEKPGTAAEIGVKFLDPEGKLGLKVPLLKNVLTEANGIKTDNLYPDIEALDKMQHYMHDVMGVGNLIDVNQFVDKSFADAAIDDRRSKEQKSVIHDDESSIHEILYKADKGTKDASKELLNKEGKYLIFTIEGQNYCMDIMKIREIIRMVPVRTFPQSPKYVLGVTNLRGTVIPVMDSRVLFNMEAIEYTDRNFIVVLESEIEGSLVQMGLAVDKVNEVANIVADQISNPPAFTRSDLESYIMAIAEIGENLNMVIDIERLLKFNRIEAPSHLAAEQV